MYHTFAQYPFVAVAMASLISLFPNFLLLRIFVFKLAYTPSCMKSSWHYGNEK